MSPHTGLYHGATDAEISASIAGREPCNYPDCGRKHSEVWHHEGQCTHRLADGRYCPNPARLHGGMPTNFCSDHSLKDRSAGDSVRHQGREQAPAVRRRREPADHSEPLSIFQQSKVALTASGEVVSNPWLGHHREAQYDAFVEASAPLAAAMPVPPKPVHLSDEDADFVAWSNSEGRYKWPMVWTPEGVAVHWGQGCIGEGVRGICHHMKENHDSRDN